MLHDENEERTMLWTFVVYTLALVAAHCDDTMSFLLLSALHENECASMPENARKAVAIGILTCQTDQFEEPLPSLCNPFEIITGRLDPKHCENLLESWLYAVYVENQSHFDDLCHAFYDESHYRRHAAKLKALSEGTRGVKDSLVEQVAVAKEVLAAQNASQLRLESALFRSASKLEGLMAPAETIRNTLGSVVDIVNHLQYFLNGRRRRDCRLQTPGFPRGLWLFTSDFWLSPWLVAASRPHIAREANSYSSIQASSQSSS